MYYVNKTLLFGEITVGKIIIYFIWFYLRIVLKMTVPDPQLLVLHVSMEFSSFLKIRMTMIIINHPHD